MKTFHLGACLAAGLLQALVSHAYADTGQSGSVIAVVQSAVIDGKTGKKLIQPASPVYTGDRITTGAAGEAQVKFLDDTRLVVGANAVLVIDAAVYNGTANKFTINAVSGVFRFISGHSPKNVYAINTPTATIGVRGTAFDVAIGGGVTRVVQHEGKTRICKRRPGEDISAWQKRQTDCVELKDACGLSITAPGAKPELVASRAERESDLRRYFRRFLAQTGFLPAFRVNTARCLVADSFGSGGTPGTPGTDEPPPPPPPPGNQKGNPGNNKPVGNAGEQPGKGGFGTDGVTGKSGQSNGNGNGNGNGKN
jgi:hypothetical protein